MLLKSVQILAMLGVIQAAPHDSKFDVRSVPIGILASTANGLVTQTLPDNITTTLTTTTTEGVAYNRNLNKMYYVEQRRDSGILDIIRSNVNGSDKEILVGMTDFYKDIYALAIDQNTNNVYYSTDNQIIFCDSELVSCTTIVASADLVSECWGLAVNPSEGAIYWTNRDPLSNLMKAGMDGSNPRVIVSGLDQPGDVIVDGKRLLWTNTPNSTIHTSDLDGGNHRVFLDLGDRNSVIGLATDEDTLYIGNWGRSAVQSCNKFNGSDLTTISAKITVRFIDLYKPQ